MKMKKIKIKFNGKIVPATVEKDLHFLGGKKVVYVLSNNVTGCTSYNLIEIVEK